jgi:hypothetical protein
MAAIVTDQFRILNVNNFIDSVENSNNSYYIFTSLPNPTLSVGFGRTADWNTNTAGPPSPVDNFNYSNHAYDTMLFGRRITAANIRRVIRRIDWEQGNVYEQYRHDYNVSNLTQTTGSTRLYDARYYVMNSDFRVYICIENGATPSNPAGNSSQDEPNFTDLEPTRAGDSGDGYVWKYLFTVNPSDIIKFDSTEYITLPSNWSTSSDPQISVIRENGDSETNNNQLKTVLIKNAGFGYGLGLDVELDILGDGTGGKCVVSTDSSGRIVDAQISAGGKGYSYGIVDLGPVQSGSLTEFAELVPIIPPSRGHGYDIYKELGAEKALVYARFDDSTKNFPTDTQFAQVGIVKNPTSFGSTTNFVSNDYSATGQIKVVNATGSLVVGDSIKQIVGTTTAIGYVASFDEETNVIKYIQDRSLYFNKTTGTQRDYIGVTSESSYVNFESSSESVTTDGGFSASVDTTFTGITTIIGNNVVNLGVNFTDGIANSQINKRSGEIIYLDNRPTIARNSRQKEDIKVVLEF